jgi:hypothetical protein
MCPTELALGPFTERLTRIAANSLLAGVVKGYSDYDFEFEDAPETAATGDSEAGRLACWANYRIFRPTAPGRLKYARRSE